jgi:hypothetical protein
MPCAFASRLRYAIITISKYFSPLLYCYLLLEQGYCSIIEKKLTWFLCACDGFIMVEQQVKDRQYDKSQYQRAYKPAEYNRHERLLDFGT